MRRSALYNWQHAKQVGASLKVKIGKLLLVTVVLLICTVSLLFTSTTNTGADRSGYRSELQYQNEYQSPRGGAVSALLLLFPIFMPSFVQPIWSCFTFNALESEGFIQIFLNGGLNQQRMGVLDAPSLQDDFYLNLVDWSSQNVLAVGLGTSVYLWNASNSKVQAKKPKEMEGGDENVELGKQTETANKYFQPQVACGMFVHAIGL